jgi:hypothetical protein
LELLCNGTITIDNINENIEKLSFTFNTKIKDRDLKKLNYYIWTEK